VSLMLIILHKKEYDVPSLQLPYQPTWPCLDLHFMTLATPKRYGQSMDCDHFELWFFNSWQCAMSSLKHDFWSFGSLKDFYCICWHFAKINIYSVKFWI
jgi:hypothetical protein